MSPPVAVEFGDRSMSSVHSFVIVLIFIAHTADDHRWFGLRWKRSAFHLIDSVAEFSRFLLYLFAPVPVAGIAWDG